MDGAAVRRWRFFKRETIVLSRPDDGSDGELHRWRLIETPVGGIMLHRHEGPDPGRVLHDHPWSFTSIVLRGGYDEERAPIRDAPKYSRWADDRGYEMRGASNTWSAGTIHTVRLDEAHRIVRLHRAPTWTLILHGPRRRRWGFYPASGYIDERVVDWKNLDLIGVAAHPVSLDSGDA